MNIRRKLGSKITGPIVPLLARVGLTPNMITLLGLLIIIVAAVMVGMRYLLIGGILVLVAGLCDILDGALARYKGRTTKFGAVLDSTLDRVSEASILIALIYFYAVEGKPVYVCLGAADILFSLLISYIKARAEALQLDCEVGWFTRTERVIVMALGLIFNLMWVALIILAVFGVITVVQRLVHVYKRAKQV